MNFEQVWWLWQTCDIFCRYTNWWIAWNNTNTCECSMYFSVCDYKKCVIHWHVERRQKYRVKKQGNMWQAQQEAASLSSVPSASRSQPSLLWFKISNPRGRPPRLSDIWCPNSTTTALLLKFRWRNDANSRERGKRSGRIPTSSREIKNSTSAYNAADSISQFRNCLYSVHVRLKMLPENCNLKLPEILFRRRFIYMPVISSYFVYQWRRRRWWCWCWCWWQRRWW